MLAHTALRLITYILPGCLALILSMAAVGQRGEGGVLTFYLDEVERPGVYLLDVGTGVLHLLNTTASPETLFVWSPDGEYLAVPLPPVVETKQFTEDDIVQTVVASGQLVMLQANGRTIGNISTDNASAKHPRPSPDGRWIAFEADDETGRQDMFLVPADGSQPPLNLTNSPDALEEVAVWSPDSTRLAYQSIDLRGTRIDAARYIYLIQPDGTHKQRVFDNGLFPSWSPDGARMVYFHWSEDRALRLTDFSSPGVVLDTGLYSRAAWSPDGRYIAYVREDAERFRLRVIDPTGQIEHDILTGFASITSPVWSPDSRRLAFGAMQNADYGLYVFDIDRGDLR